MAPGRTMGLLLALMLLLGCEQGGGDSFTEDDDIEADEEHGTGVSEIIYDLVPEVTLYLSNRVTYSFGISLNTKCSYNNFR